VFALTASRIYLILSAVSTFAGSLMFTVLAVYYVQTVGLNPLQLVLVGTVVEATIFIFEVPTGVIADTYSRRLSVIVGHILVGVCFVLEGLVPLFAAILLAEVIRGLGETFISGAREAWIADEIGEERLAALFLRTTQVRQIASLLGIAASVGLASLWLNLPVVLGGALLITLGLFLALVMPETGFRPTPRGERASWQAMGTTLRDGVKVARGRPVVLTMLATAAIFGMFSEGFDRLEEAHLLTTIGLPPLGSLAPVVWFGIINAGASLLSLPVVEIVRRRVDVGSAAKAARALIAVNGLIAASVILFGLAPNFAVAVAALWLATVMRHVNGPIVGAWLNQGLDPRVRATVLSMNGQANAFGQIGGGPVIGLVGTVVSLRAALVGSGLLLTPCLLLFARFLRHPEATASSAPSDSTPATAGAPQPD
jgi:DHA3 family tetracycline resistance protein-like MFS transporter